MGSTISRQWADYAARLRYEELPAEAVRAAKMLLIDALGCALAGSTSEDSRILCRVLSDLGGRPECTVIGTDFMTNCRDASFANALAIRALDYNDVYWRQDPSHPSDLLPAALSVGEREHRSGKDLLVAMVIAYELEMRICEAAIPGLRELGWHHASLTQFVSPVVAGSMLRLSREQLVHAIGISGTHNGTLGAVAAGKLTMMKNTVDPMATESGVMAALLARAGYQGPEEVFEGREGLFDSLGKEWDASRLVEGLGKTFKITQCSIKLFPSEALTHAPISAVLDLVRRNDLHSRDIEHIRVYTLQRAVEILADPSKYDIHSRETADHSLPYCVAAAAVDRELTPRQFLPHKLSDAGIQEMMQRVSVKPERAFEARFPADQPCRVEIRLRDGRLLESERAFPKGDPRDPLTEEEVVSKFQSLAQDVIGRENQHAVLERTLKLESLDDLGLLMRGLAAGSNERTELH